MRERKSAGFRAPQAPQSITAEYAEKARRSQRARDALSPLRLLRDLCGYPYNSPSRALAPSPAWVPAFAGMSGAGREGFAQAAWPERMRAVSPGGMTRVLGLVVGLA